MAKRIVILGGGFAGAYTAMHLEKRMAELPDVEILLASQENFLLFTPMLHEVAAGDVGVSDVVQPLRKMLRRSRIAIVEIESIDLRQKMVRFLQPDLQQHFERPYDQLVLSIGAVPNFHRTPGMEEHAVTMKTLGDGILLRNRVIEALELADTHPDDNERKALLTVVIAGAGFAGAETAGAVNDLMREAIPFYPHLKEEMLRIVLVSSEDRILQELSPSLGRYAVKAMRRRGVEILLNSRATSYNGRELTLADGTTIDTRLVVWTAGITPSPLISQLPCQHERGMVVTDECLAVPGWSGVWALGDCALVPDILNPGSHFPPTAQHAIREAAVVADNIVAYMQGRPLRPFRFKTLGMLATIGRRTGVAEILGLRFSGIVAWFLWRSIYLGKLPGVQKKIRVALDWALDLVFSKDIVELPTLPSKTMSGPEALPATRTHEDESRVPELIHK